METPNDCGRTDESDQGPRRLSPSHDVRREDLIVKQVGPGKLTVTEVKGDVAMVTIADLLQSNGVIHVIDTVLLPN